MRYRTLVVGVVAVAGVVGSLGPSASVAQDKNGEKPAAPKKAKDFRQVVVELTLYLQTERGNTGIEVMDYRAVGAGKVVRTDTSKFTKTDTVITSEELRRLLKHSTDLGAKPEELVFLHAGGNVDRILLGIKLGDARVAPELSKAYMKRFKSTVPLNINLVWNGDDQLFVGLD